MYEYPFERLDVYKASLQFSVKLRGVLKSFPDEEKYDLVRQIKRSADSISSCLAEGSGRSTRKDQAYFTNVAYSSALETVSHLKLAFKLEYIDENKLKVLRKSLSKITFQLNKLYQYQIKASDNLKDNMDKG